MADIIRKNNRAEVTYMSLDGDDFMQFGVGGLAYIKKADDNVDNIAPQTYELYGADGEHIATGTDVTSLQSIAMDHQLIPLNAQ